jgi:SAM-dependent methyltransferase
VTTTRTSLYRFTWGVQRWLTPGLQNSQYAYRDLLLSALTPYTRWLDLGCGHQILPDWMPDSAPMQPDILNRCRLAVGIDGDLRSLRENHFLRNKLRGDIQQLPFSDNSFDLVTANVVVEHVGNPRALLHEVRRVLVPGGLFMFHTPNSTGYTTIAANLLPHSLRVKMAYLLQGRREEDVFPTFYRMNSLRSIRRLARESYLDLKEVRLVESSPQTAMLGPVVIFELLWILALRSQWLRNLRTNIIAVLQKPAA